MLGINLRLIGMPEFLDGLMRAVWLDGASKGLLLGLLAGGAIFFALGKQAGRQGGYLEGYLAGRSNSPFGGG